MPEVPDPLAAVEAERDTEGRVPASLSPGPGPSAEAPIGSSSQATAVPRADLLSAHVVEAVAEHLATVHVAPNDPDGEFDWNACEGPFKRSFRLTARAILTVAAEASGTAAAQAAETSGLGPEGNGPTRRGTP